MRRVLPLLISFLLGGALAILWPAPAMSYGRAEHIPLGPAQAPPMRLLLPTGWGYDVGWDCCQATELTQLQGTWYTDYHPAYNTDCLNLQQGVASVYNAQRANMSWWWMPPACLGAIAAAEPRGTTWILGNEDNLPGGCAPATQCWALQQGQIAAIRAGDRYAHIASGGIADADPVYAAALVAAGARYDAWVVHYYSLSAATYYARVARFRAWMDGAGLAGVPLLIGEVGAPPGTSDAVAASFLTQIRALPPGVRAATWFGARSAGRWSGDLLRSDGTLTATGRAFRGLLAPQRRLHSWH